MEGENDIKLVEETHLSQDTQQSSSPENPLKPPKLDEIYPMPMAIMEWGEKKDQRAVGLLDTGSPSTLMDERMFDLLDKETYKEYPCKTDISSVGQNKIKCTKKIHIKIKLIDYIESPDGTMEEGDQNNKLFTTRVFICKDLTNDIIIGRDAMTMGELSPDISMDIGWRQRLMDREDLLDRKLPQPKPKPKPNSTRKKDSANHTPQIKPKKEPKGANNGSWGRHQKNNGMTKQNGEVKNNNRQSQDWRNGKDCENKEHKSFFELL